LVLIREQYIRKNCGELDGVPVIVLTAKADNDFKVKLFKDGAQVKELQKQYYLP